MRRNITLVLFFLIGLSVYAQSPAIEQIAGQGTSSMQGQLGEISSLTTDVAGNLYICDKLNNRVMKWVPGSAQGAVVAGGSGAGSGINQLNTPTCVRLDKNGNLYIADAGNNRVLKVDLSTNQVTVSLSGLKGVENIFVDAQGNIYASSRTQHVVRKYPASGALGYIVAGGEPLNTDPDYPQSVLPNYQGGIELNELKAPGEIYVDNVGDLFIVDEGNNRLLKYELAENAIRGSVIYSLSGIKSFGVDKRGKYNLLNSGKITKLNSFSQNIDEGVTGFDPVTMWIERESCACYIAGKSAIYKWNLTNPKIDQRWGTTICGDSPIYLRANGDGIRWYRDDQPLPSSENELRVVEPGVYKATQSNGCAVSSFSEPVPITKPSLPSKPSISSNTGSFSIPPGQSIILSVPRESSNYTYKWNTTQTGTSISVTSTGDYYVEVFNEQGCSVNSDIVHVTGLQRPVIKLVNNDAEKPIAGFEYQYTYYIYPCIKQNSGYLEYQPAQGMETFGQIVWYEVTGSDWDSELSENYPRSVVEKARGINKFFPQRSGYYASAISFVDANGVNRLTKYSEIIEVKVSSGPPQATLLHATLTELCVKNDNKNETTNLYFDYRYDGFFKVFYNGQLKYISPGWWNSVQLNAAEINGLGGIVKVSVQACNGIGQSPMSGEITLTGDIRPKSPVLDASSNMTVVGSKPALVQVDPDSYKSNFKNVITYWYKGNGEQIGKGNEIELKEPGPYYLKGFNECSFSEISSFNISYQDPPARLTITADKTALCTSSAVATITTNRPGTTLYWFKDDVPLGQQVTILTGDAGYYYASENIDGSDPSNIITIERGTELAVPLIEIPKPYVTDASGNYYVSQPNRPLLLVAPSGYSGYLWSNGEKTEAIEVTSAGDYSVTVLNEIGCSSTSTVIHVNGLPVPQITANRLSLCKDDNAILTAGSNYSSVYWFRNGTDIGSPASQTLTVTEGGEYQGYIKTGLQYVTADASTEFLNKSETIVIEKQIVAKPTISSSGTNSLPANGTLTLTASAAFRYQWSGKTTAGTAIPIFNSTSQSINVSQVGLYQVTVYNENNCSNVSGELAILPTQSGTYNPPVPPIDAGTISCAKYVDARYLNSQGVANNSVFYKFVLPKDGQVSLSNSGANTWEDTDIYLLDKNGTVISSSTRGTYPYTAKIEQASLTSSILPAGTYYVITQYKGNPSLYYSPPVQTTINIYSSFSFPENPSINVVGYYPVACDGNLVTLEAPEAATYLWSTGETTRTIKAQSSGQYFVTISNGYGCSATTPSVSIFLYPKIDATITQSGPATPCSGDVVTLSVPSGYQGYKWSTGATGNSIEVRKTGVYYVRILNGSCLKTSNFKIVKFGSIAKPSITASPGNSNSYCGGRTVWLRASSGYKSYLWSNGATTQEIAVTAAGIYAVTATNYNGCSATSDAKTITFKSAPLGDIQASGPTSFCTGGSVTLSAPEADRYFWVAGGTNQIIGTSRDLTVTSSDTYFVFLFKGNGCNVVKSQVVSVYPIRTPRITVFGSTTICPSSGVTLLASAGYKSYLWSDGSTERTIRVVKPGNYTVTVENFSGCSLTSNVKEIKMYPMEYPVITSSSDKICKNGSVSIAAPAGYTNYLWSNNRPEQVIQVTEPGNYSVTVTNASGCTFVSDILTIGVNDVLSAPHITRDGPEEICAGQTLTLNTTSEGVIKWYRGLLQVGTGKSFRVKVAGTYTAAAFNDCGPSLRSNAITVKVNPVLQAKASAFDDISYEIPNIENYDDTEAGVKSDLLTEISESCEGQAENWMKAFAGSGLSSAQADLLKQRLIAICKAGGDLEHPDGASDVPATITDFAGPRTFADAITSVIPGQSFTAKLNPWLLDSPYPYNNQPKVADAVIGSSSEAICVKLTALKTACGNPATDEAFYSCLEAQYKDALNITLEDFKRLTKSCYSCNYLLDDPMPFPVFLDPKSKGCITKSEFNQAITDLKSLVPGLLSATESYSDIFNKDNRAKLEANPTYEQNIANYLNQKWGFTSSFREYSEYAKLSDGTAELLCASPAYPMIEPPIYADIQAKIGTAVGSGKRDYSEYIPALRKSAMLEYTKICASAKPSVDLKESSSAYHYTLYYYDQADNLIRTVPPEGVKVLGNEELKWVTDARKHQDDLPCMKDSGFPTDEKTDESLQNLTNVLASGNRSVEMWFYNSASNSTQLLASTPTTTLGEYGKKFMLHTALDGNRINVEVFTLEQNAAAPGHVTFTNSNQVVADLSPAGPLHPWTHVVIQSADFQKGELKVFVNGKALSAVMGPHNLTSGWEVLDGAKMPQKLTDLKYMRLYERPLELAEIQGNSSQSCFMLADKPELKTALSAALSKWYRYNIPQKGAETLAAGDNPDKIETRYTQIYPDHNLKTDYAYNTSNQVIQQTTPDGGTSRFWYDDLSRLLVSQNAQQKLDKNFSYTEYDVLGRITEVGQKYYNPTNADDTLNRAGAIDKRVYGLFAANTAKSQITQTIYDEKPAAVKGVPANLEQDNLRKRVAASIYRDSPNSENINASYYSYDLSGNVKRLVQQIDGLGTKKIDYEYDLASGKVNFVAYQHNEPDRFYYQYKYDAENRLVEAYSGIAAIVQASGVGSTMIDPDRRLDASYQYYLHGPLARMELNGFSGKVQGVDYAYTLQGWLKGVNGQALNPETEMGRDGIAGSTIAKDVYAYSLGYYNGDYSPIKGNAATFGLSYQAQAGDITGHNLYNGNISNTTIAISKFRNGEPSGYTYRYDQLNRLKEMQYHHLSGTTWNAATAVDSLRESVSYDGNGNILTYLRNGNGKAKPLAMDQLSYVYKRDNTGRLLNNQLLQVKDAVAAGNYSEDIDNQAETNYSYDKIGNLIADKAEGISKIDWTVYGKIDKITKTDGTVIDYTYDASGNRVSKNVNGILTWYSRDAQGNSLAVYDNKGGGVNWKEQQLYGSSRLGMWRPEEKLSSTQNTTVWTLAGKKSFELTNHLGNVLAVVSDKRSYLGASTANYEGDVVSAQDYYPFGMQEPGRAWHLGDNYRYGFNGKENDNEVKDVEGSQQDYGMRIYDGRIGRFLSVDPITAQYPELTPYQFAGNTPVQAIDLDGLEPVYTRLIPGSQVASFSNVSEDMVYAYFFLSWRASMKSSVCTAGALLTQQVPGTIEMPILRKDFTVMVTPGGTPYIYEHVIVQSRTAALGSLVLDGLGSAPSIEKGGMSTGIFAKAPAKSAIIREVESGLKSISRIYNDGKHIARKKAAWSEIVNETRHGFAKFVRNVDVDALTIEAWRKGTDVVSDEGNKIWRIYESKEVIGASSGKESRWMRVELTESTKELHSHPIDKQEFDKLMKRKKN